MMQTSGPVDGNLSRLFVQFHCRGNRTSSRQLTELVESVEYWTILAYVEPLHLLVVLTHVVRSDGPEKPDVVVAVELGHLLLGRLVGPVDLHLPVEPIVEQKVVGHPYPMGLHGVTLPIVVVANVTVIVVADPLPAVRSDAHLRPLLFFHSVTVPFTPQLPSTADQTLCCTLAAAGSSAILPH